MHNEPFSPVFFLRFFGSRRYKALSDYQRGWYWGLWMEMARRGGSLPLDSELWAIAGAATPGFFAREKRKVLDCFETREGECGMEIYSERLIHSLQVAEKLRLAANVHKSPIREKSHIYSSRFVVPSVEEVKSYCEERRNSIDAEQFVNFYAAKGWKIGKSPMKDWKASVRTWERNQQHAVNAVGWCDDPKHMGRNNRGFCWECGRVKR